MREETDIIGSLSIPDDYPFGIHTYRSEVNFSFSNACIRQDIFAGMVQIKKACAIANFKAGILERAIAENIIKACDIIYDNIKELTPRLHPFQGGAGTSVNMACNELIANYALKCMNRKFGEYSIVSPLDHVNLSQSTNDTFPTAVRIALLNLLKSLHDNTEKLLNVLQGKEKEFSDILKIGRTELQDAMPLGLGQVFSAYADAVGRFEWRLNKASDWIREINLTGTAVGTGINADREYAGFVIDELRNISKAPVTLSRNLIDATQNLDQVIEVSGIIKTGAVSIKKMSSDIRLLSSGPVCGIAELIIPAVQAGSSIMPGKINPVMFEAAEQICLHIMGGDHTISIAASESNLELPQFLPYIADILLNNMELFNKLIEKLADHIKGIRANKQKIRHYLENSHAIATLLVPAIGYEKMSNIVRTAKENNLSILELIKKENIIPKKMLDKLISPAVMATPGLPLVEEENA